MACLALGAFGVDARRWAGGLAWLADVQRQDGCVPVSGHVSWPGWSTGLAALAWIHSRTQNGCRYEAHIETATAWLLRTRGSRLKPESSSTLGHDATLQGWPWVENTHSWVEPTSYAILALRAAGKTDHPRLREGIRVLLDRTLPSGGWNYGNTRVFDNTLRPFPVTTGIVLTALAGEPTGKRVETSIAYLTQTLQHIRSPLSVGWGLIGLTSWNSRPRQARDWLARAAARTRKGQPNVLQDALLLLADADRCPLGQVTTGGTHG